MVRDQEAGGSNPLAPTNQLPVRYAGTFRADQAELAVAVLVTDLAFAQKSAPRPNSLQCVSASGLKRPLVPKVQRGGDEYKAVRIAEMRAPQGTGSESHWLSQSEGRARFRRTAV
jgi:hypothetical protein